MFELELGGDGTAAPLLDLNTVEEGRRAAVWCGSAPVIFPGLSVRQVDPTPPVGSIRRVTMAEGTLWSIAYPAARVRYAPCANSRTKTNFTLMMQLHGSVEVAQTGRSCVLAAGDICFTDESFPFRIDSRAGGEIMFLQMPRSTVLGRNPHLERYTASLLCRTQPGTSLIADTLSSTSRLAPLLREEGRRAVLLALMHLLGAAEVNAPDLVGVNGWRTQAALAFIEIHLARPGLCADDVAHAQCISRRYLDRLLHEALGVSIAGQIWKCRLERAATQLRDSNRAHLAVSQVAFATGFQDAAHFTRAFRRRFGCTPTRWRAAGTVCAIEDPVHPMPTPPQGMRCLT